MLKSDLEQRKEVEVVATYIFELEDKVENHVIKEVIGEVNIDVEEMPDSVKINGFVYVLKY